MKISNVLLLSLPLVALMGIGCSAAAPGGENTASSTDQALDQAALSHVESHPWKPVCADSAPGKVHCLAKIRTNEAGVPEVTTVPQGFGPKDPISAYDLPTSTQTKTVALIDAQDDPDAEVDLGTYRKTYGLPACTTANGCFKKVDQTGGTNYPAPDTGWAGEIMLDIEMVSAGCPSCKILLVEASSESNDDLGTAVNTAVTLGAAVVSNSYGGSEDSSNSTYDTEYYHHIGVAIFASAGDDAYGVEYPAAGQWVIGVGGTSLATSSSTRGWAESAWSDSGSGCSKYTPKPAWQTDKGCAHKMVSDLSAIADPNTGVAVYDVYGSGGWAVYGGTSVASPLVSAIFAATGHATAYGATVWRHTTDFNDIVGGSNGTCVTKYFCTAVAGYDGPTGWGTPIGAKLQAWGVAPSDLEANSDE
jgi:subtilase family serine protease